MKGLSLAAAATAALLAVPVLAQDATKADPNHYKVVFENDQVRVLRVKMGPKEKSVMHEHPDAVAVFLTDAHVKFMNGDGKSDEATVPAGRVSFTPALKHLPENAGYRTFELVLVELKNKGSAPPTPPPAPRAAPTAPPKK